MMDEALTCQAIFDALSEPLIVLDSEEVIQFVNRAAADLLQMNAADLVGRTLDCLPGGETFTQRARPISELKEVALNPIPPDWDEMRWSAPVGRHALTIQTWP